MSVKALHDFWYDQRKEKVNLDAVMRASENGRDIHFVYVRVNVRYLFLSTNCICFFTLEINDMCFNPHTYTKKSNTKRD